MEHSTAAAEDLLINLVRRDGRRLCRCPRIEMSLLETAGAIEQSSRENTAVVVGDEEGERGALRVKIVVSKQQLKKMALLVRRERGGTEQLLQLLRRLQVESKSLDAAAAKGRRDRWRPALQSIPEEMWEL